MKRKDPGYVSMAEYAELKGVSRQRISILVQKGDERILTKVINGRTWISLRSEWVPNNYDMKGRR